MSRYKVECGTCFIREAIEGAAICEWCQEIAEKKRIKVTHILKVGKKKITHEGAKDRCVICSGGFYFDVASGGKG